MPGTLSIVATPIGNLEDITIRALTVLREADFIACEDTRHTKILLDRHGISRPLISYHQHSRLQKIDYLIGLLLEGRSIALVSDAGTPGISDPGSVLVAKALDLGIPVVPIPGPSAVTALASAAGISMDRYVFLGFLPHKKGRETMLNILAASDIPVVFYESPHRIEKTLQWLVAHAPDGRLIAGRELTKKFEEIVRGTPSEMLACFGGENARGEFVLIFYR